MSDFFATSWTVARQAPSSMGFSRQEHWSGVPFPSPGDLPDPGIELRSHILQEYALPAEPPGKTKNTEVGSLSLLQQIFVTQELNWGLLHWQADSLPAEPPGKPIIEHSRMLQMDSYYICVLWK